MDYSVEVVQEISMEEFIALGYETVLLLPEFFVTTKSKLQPTCQAYKKGILDICKKWLKHHLCDSGCTP